MTIMPQPTLLGVDTGPSEPDSETRERRQLAAAELLIEQRKAEERLAETRRTLVVAARRHGLPGTRIAELLRCSRGPVDAILNAAIEAGELEPPTGRNKARPRINAEG